MAKTKDQPMKQVSIDAPVEPKPRISFYGKELKKMGIKFQDLKLSAAVTFQGTGSITRLGSSAGMDDDNVEITVKKFSLEDSGNFDNSFKEAAKK